MEKLNQLLLSLNPKLFERRQELCQEMLRLEKEGIDCAHCTGICCSFIANSMQTTPLETLEIINYLSRHHLLNEELLEKLHQVIKDYRLDYHLDTGSGLDFRRTYNCPFYRPGSKGCSLSRTVKPLGCLAFNPGKLNITEGEACAPGFEALKNHQVSWSAEEDMANQFISNTLKLYWQKLPMPLAIIEVYKKLI